MRKLGPLVCFLRIANFKSGKLTTLKPRQDWSCHAKRRNLYCKNLVHGKDALKQMVCQWKAGTAVLEVVASSRTCRQQAPILEEVEYLVPMPLEKFLSPWNRWLESCGYSASWIVYGPRFCLITVVLSPYTRDDLTSDQYPFRTGKKLPCTQKNLRSVVLTSGMDCTLLSYTCCTTDPMARWFCRRGKFVVAGNEGHEQAGKADRTVVPLWQNPLAIGSVCCTYW